MKKKENKINKPKYIAYHEIKFSILFDTKNSHPQ